jgi:trans-2,3-dihydro-3-hydroxyanthranilate isomerase
MRSYRFFQLDVFTDKAFFGNPLAVFPEAAGITDEEMQKIALEMNLSETVFVLPSEHANALRKLRIFTPARELPMAGHPVVGTWNLLPRLGVLPEVDEDYSGRVEIFHELNIGVLPVEIDIEWGVPQKVTMTQGKFIAGEIVTEEAALAGLAESLGLEPADLNSELPVPMPIQVMETGIKSLAVPVRSLDALSRIKVNTSLLSDIYLNFGAVGAYVFTLETFGGPPARAHARFFAPGDNIPEDAATGSACGALSSYLVHHGVVTEKDEDGFHRFLVEQGDFMKRPSRLFAEIKGGPGNVELTRIGGSSVVVLQGELML